MNRNQIYQALFDIGSGISWDSPARTWAYYSRRLQIWTECPNQPAFYQVEHDNEIGQMTGMPYKNVLKATWIVYQDTAKDETVVGAIENNLILDALQAAMAPQIVAGQQYVDRNTLGGLVYHAFIDGVTFQDGGDLDGQGVMTIPITLLVP